MEEAPASPDPHATLCELVAQHEAERLRVTGDLNQPNFTKGKRERLESWHADMVDHFVGELNFAFMRLINMPHDWLHLPLVAFCARNSLELSIWIRFCMHSPENSRRFYEDKFRDAIGFFEGVERLLRTLTGNEGWEAPVGLQKSAMYDLAASVGVDLRDDLKFKRVSEAAREIQMDELYASANTILSKCAHPPSMIALNYFTPEFTSSLDGLVTVFKILGVAFGVGGWKAIADFVEGLHPTPPA